MRQRDTGVNFITDNALELIIEDKAVRGVKCEKGIYYAEKVIVATGGKSYQNPVRQGMDMFLQNKLRTQLLT